LGHDPRILDPLRRTSGRRHRRFFLLSSSSSFFSLSESRPRRLLASSINPGAAVSHPLPPPPPLRPAPRNSSGTPRATKDGSELGSIPRKISGQGGIGSHLQTWRAASHRAMMWPRYTRSKKSNEIADRAKTAIGVCPRNTTKHAEPKSFFRVFRVFRGNPSDSFRFGDSADQHSDPHVLRALD